MTIALMEPPAPQAATPAQFFGPRISYRERQDAIERDRVARRRAREERKAATIERARIALKNRIAFTERELGKTTGEDRLPLELSLKALHKQRATLEGLVGEKKIAEARKLAGLIYGGKKKLGVSVGQYHVISLDQEWGVCNGAPTAIGNLLVQREEEVPHTRFEHAHDILAEYAAGSLGLEQAYGLLGRRIERLRTALEDQKVRVFEADIYEFLANRQQQYEAVQKALLQLEAGQLTRQQLLWRYKSCVAREEPQPVNLAYIEKAVSRRAAKESPEEELARLIREQRADAAEEGLFKPRSKAW